VHGMRFGPYRLWNLIYTGQPGALGSRTLAGPDFPGLRLEASHTPARRSEEVWARQREAWGCGKTVPACLSDAEPARRRNLLLSFV
jgi:hypothetical protein